jgi:ligand-binding sensor domain-containing protein/serine phosphatase RsbU (regulator of sigma subunit)
MFKQNLTIVLSFLIVFAAPSQNNIWKNNEFVFQNYNHTDGISVNRTKTIIQDKFGFIWIGTTHGINIFDGFSFDVYQHNPLDSFSIPSNLINCFESGDKKGLWIGSTDGLIQFDYVKKTFVKKFTHCKVSTSLSGTYINKLLRDDDQNLWIATTNGLTLCQAETSETTIFPEFSEKNISGLYNDRNGDIWVLTEGALFRYIKAKNEFVQCLNTDNQIVEIQEINNTGKFLVAFSHKVLMYEKKTGSTELFFQLSTDDKMIITALLYDKSGNTWIGTDNGIVFRNFYSEKFELIKHNPNNMQSLCDNHISSFYQDKSGIVWIATNGGISTYDAKNIKFKPYLYTEERPERLSSSFVWGMIEDSEGYFWIGTNKGLNKFDITTGIYEHYFKQPNQKNTLADNRVISLAEDTSGYIWIGTDKGICKLNRKTNAFENVENLRNQKGLRDDYITNIKMDKKGNIWIATFSSGLFKLSPNGTTIRNYLYNASSSKSISSNGIVGIYIDQFHKVWISTEKGVDVYNEESDDFIRINPSQDKKRTLRTICAVRLNDTIVLLGTDYGLYYSIIDSNFNLRHLTRYSTANGLPDNKICGLLTDHKNNLWVSTKNGLCKVQKNNLFENRLSFRVYDETEGIQSSEFLVQSFTRGDGGRLLFGGTKGFNIVNADDITDNKYIPDVIISDLYIFNKKVEIIRTNINEEYKNHIVADDNNYYLHENISTASQLILSHREKMFSLHFVSLHFSKPWKNSYAYKLEGFDNDWNYTGNNHSATYTNIPAGTYYFKVKASNSDGVWNEFGSMLKIIITPPWWQTWWFRIATIIVILLLLILYIKLRERKLLRDKLILERTVDERTAELKQKNEELFQQKEEIESQRDEIESQKDLIIEHRDALICQKLELETVHNELKSSIHYALRIQNAILPDQRMLSELASDSFILNKPKDIISGDFYWFQQRNNYTLIAVADCTGHGVPGAFMSMLGISFLNEIVTKDEDIKVSKILDELRQYVIRSLQQKGVSDEGSSISMSVKDGMDISFIALDLSSSICEGKECYNIQFAGANNPLWVIRNSNNQSLNSKQNSESSLEFDASNLEFGALDLEFVELKADKMPIAIHVRMEPFTNHDLVLHAGDSIYLMSDGYEDQFGGENSERAGKKFLSKNLKKIMLVNSQLSMSEQKVALEKTLENWIGNTEQIDDITILGFKI